MLTDGHGAQGDVLTAYEQQVLNHLHRLTAGTVNGVTGAGIEVAGLRLQAPWWRRFSAAVTADARRARAVPETVEPVAARRPGGAGRHRRMAAVALGARRRRDGRRRVAASASRGSRSSPSPSPIVAWRIVKRAASQAQRPTATGLATSRRVDVVAGLDGATRLRRGVERRRQQHQPRARLRRRLRARRAGQRRTAGGPRGRPHGVEQRRRAVARRQDPLPVPARLRSPSGAGPDRRTRRRHRHRPAAAPPPRHRQRLHARPSSSTTTSPTRRTSSTTSPSDSPPSCSCRCCGCCGSSSPERSTCSPPIERRGLVVRARRPQRVVPYPWLLGPLARRDRYSLFVAVDDGRSDRVSAWLANERTAVPQGARARVRATPLLGYVRSAEPIGTQ